MPSKIGVLKYYFIAAFLVLSAGVTIYEWVYAIPFKKCEATQGWWSSKYMKCFQPIDLSTLTGRPHGVKASTGPTSASAATSVPVATKP